MWDYAAIIDRARKDGAELEFYGPQSPEAVRELETRFGVKLPPSFVAFLSAYGGGGPFPGISGVYAEDMYNAGTVIGDTELARETYQLPAHFLVVHADADLNLLWCLDFSQQRIDGECPVVSVDPETHAIESLLANSFYSFLAQYLNPGGIS